MSPDTKVAFLCTVARLSGNYWWALRVKVSRPSDCLELQLSQNRLAIGGDKHLPPSLRRPTVSPNLSLQFLNFYVILDHSVTCYGQLYAVVVSDKNIHIKLIISCTLCLKQAPAYYYVMQVVGHCTSEKSKGCLLYYIHI